MQQTSEYNKKRNKLIDIENKPVVTSGLEGPYMGRGLRGTNYRYKISYKDILYNMG